MDKTTKILLAIIAIGILMSALNPWIKPVKVEASALQSDYILRSIDSTLEEINSNVRNITKILNPS